MENDYFKYDINDLTNMIGECIVELAELRKELDDAGKEKAKSISEYYRTRAKITMELKAGKVKELDGEKIQSPGLTIIPTLSKGLSWKELFNRELAEVKYKSLTAKMESIKAEMNALQSIKRVQETITK